MNENSYIFLVLFYTYRYYKRVDLTNIRKDFVLDLERCAQILTFLFERKPFDLYIKVLEDQVLRLHQLGYSLNFSRSPFSQSCLCDSIYYDLVVIMRKINKEMLRLSKKPFYKTNIPKIKRMLMAIHNIPRAFLNEDINDITMTNIHMSYDDVKKCIFSYLGNKYL